MILDFGGIGVIFESRPRSSMLGQSNLASRDLLSCDGSMSPPRGQTLSSSGSPKYSASAQWNTPSPTKQLLTLTTCNPRWASTQRLIVFSHLVETTPRSAGRPAALKGGR